METKKGNHKKNAWKMLEPPMEVAIPCKMGTKKHSGLQEAEAKSDESNMIQKTTQADIVEAHESTRKRLRSTPTKYHEDNTAEKEFNSISHCTLVHKFIPILQAMKILGAKEAVDK